MSTRKSGTINLNLNDGQQQRIIQALEEFIVLNWNCLSLDFPIEQYEADLEKLQSMRQRAQDRMVKSEKVSNHEVITSADVNPIS